MITSLLDADEEQYYREMRECDDRMRFAMAHPTLASILDKLFTLKIKLIELLICKRVGHNMEDTGSYGGPDSGCIDLTCRRCGYNFHHILY